MKTVAVGLLFIVAASIARAQAAMPETTLPEVVVIGTPIQQAPPSFVWSGPTSVMSALDGHMSHQALITHRQIVRASIALRDVRCVASDDLKDTTSHSDVLTRWLAATSVYIKLSTASAGLRSGVIGTVRNPITGVSYQAYKVTYADNGTETWMILPNAAYSSVKLLDQPLPDSLILGDGTVKVNPICPARA